jgi:lysozyme family protein
MIVEEIYMSNFDEAIKVVLKHEGGYVNNVHDAGGATNFGVSLRFLADHPEIGDFDHDGDVDVEDIKNMTVEDACAVYRSLWWDKFGYTNINDQTIATKVFDLSVNMGAKRAHILMQTALNDAFGLNLTVDGILGPASIHVINSCTDGDQEQALLTAYCDEAWAFYQRIIAKNPAQSVFARGWKARAYDLCTANMLDASTTSS